MIYKGYYNSTIGVIEIVATENEITGISFCDENIKAFNSGNNISEIINKCIEELDEYFKGVRKEFSVKINLKGTEFQMKVWKALSKIPYGKTASYKDVACLIDNEKAVRAVGGANNKNKIPIIVPCHRVIGKDGSLVGYGEGIWRKEWLLEHERKNMQFIKEKQ